MKTMATLDLKGRVQCFSMQGVFS